MSNNLARKLRRRQEKQNQKKARKERRQQMGGCYAEGCKRLGDSIVCVTCEKLGRDTSWAACEVHWGEGMAKMKKHALVKHPVNIIRAIGAGLRGEDVT